MSDVFCLIVSRCLMMAEARPNQDVSERHVVEALVVALVVIMLDGCLDLAFQIPG